jgi:drug/metabolite transporter (DMT)-like permease
MTHTPRLDATGWTLIAILSVLWGGSFILIELGLRSFPPMTLVFLRLALAVPPMWIAMRFMGQHLPSSPRIWAALTIVGAINCAFPFMLFFWGQQYLDSGYASILNATTPLWGVFAAHFLTKDEKATPMRILGVLVGLAGILVMVGPQAMRGLSHNLLAQIACLGSTVFYSFAAIYSRRLSRQKLTPMAIATGQTLTGALIMIPFMLLIDQPWTLAMPSLASTLATVALAVFATGLAYGFYFQLIDRAGAANAMLVAFVIPILAVILGIAFLNEALSGGQVIGAGLIAFSLIILDGRAIARLAPSKTVL